MMRGKWVLVLCAVALAGLVYAAWTVMHREPERNSAADRATNAGAAPAPAEVTLPARIQAQQVVPVTVEITGAVAEFLADVGQEVYQGELLARISNQSLESARENAAQAVETAQERVNKLQSAIIAARLEASRARADAERSRAEMERTDKIWRRQKMLYGEGATPRLAYEKSEKEALSVKSEFDSLDTLARQAEERTAAMLAELDNTKKILSDKITQLDDSREHLKAAEVYSPVDGIVVARRGEVGKALDENGSREIFQIAVNTALLQAVVEAHPSALERIHVEQPAMLFFADIPTEGVPGTVAEIKSDHALINFVSPSAMIKPGMTAQVRLKLE